MKKLFQPLLIAMIFASSPVLAGIATTYNLVTTPGNASKMETKGYAGLRWSLDGGTTPSLILGAIRAKIKSNGDVEGANLALQLHVFGGFHPGKLKLSYLNGKDDLQGELGAGYDLFKSTPFLSLGANAPYVNAGVDYNVGSGFDPYATLYTQGKLDKPTGTSTSCVADGSLVSGHYTSPTCTGPTY